ncbi:TPA: hypothetical protein ACOAY7_002958 [Vibrio cholerae]|nr:excisionase [Vibrio phage ICP1]QVV97906.1 excisionase [Vibrio phage ICP1]QVV98133.1 excisionase [Vibrio phage ICP1]QVV98359.1 excisionase [Vibrio phage ICP1]QVV98586.1 excisionase [Vibrio phage ICP1]
MQVFEFVSDKGYTVEVELFDTPPFRSMESRDDYYGGVDILDVKVYDLSTGEPVYMHGITNEEIIQEWEMHKDTQTMREDYGHLSIIGEEWFREEQGICMSKLNKVELAKMIGD